MSAWIELLEYLKKEWPTLKGALWVFIVTFVLAGILGYGIGAWYYARIIEWLRERMQLSNERIQAKDDQLDDYRARLHLVSATGTAYSHMTKDELREKTLATVSEIRDFLEQYSTEQHKLLEKSRQTGDAKTEEERHQVWTLFTNKITELYNNQNLYYTNNFKTDTILLRDELLSRLPKSVRNEEAYSMYEYPVNPIGMEMVATDLERLAKSLP